MTPSHTEVIIAGAGPSGLMVAAELAAAGVTVTILERRAEPALPRAGTITPRVLEIFACRGFLVAAISVASGRGRSGTGRSPAASGGAGGVLEVTGREPDDLAAGQL